MYFVTAHFATQSATCRTILLIGCQLAGGKCRSEATEAATCTNMPLRQSSPLDRTAWHQQHTPSRQFAIREASRTTPQWQKWKRSGVPSLQCALSKQQLWVSALLVIHSNQLLLLLSERYPIRYQRQLVMDFFKRRWNFHTSLC